MSSFLDEYTSTMMEYDHFSPEEFHLPVALWAMGGIVGRQAFTTLPNGSRVYPSIYVLMVGPSGVGKSSYKGALSGIIQPVSPESILWNEGSYEHLAECLVKATGKLSGLTAYDEFGNILSACDASDRNYKLNNLLMTVFETGSVLRLGYKKNKEAGIPDAAVVVDSAMSILGCIPPEELENLVGPQKAVNKGLIPRFLMVTTTNGRKKKYKWAPPVSKMKFREMARSLFDKVPLTQTEYIMTREARDRFVGVVNAVFEEREEYPQYAAFLNRVPIKTLKVGMILAIDRERIGIIDEEDIADAHNLVCDYTQSMIGMSAGSGFVLGKLAGLLKELRNRDKVPYSEVYKLTPIRTKREAHDMLQTAEEMNLLKITSKGKRRFIVGVN